MTKITQENIKSLFDYDNGELYWKVRSAKNIHIGDKAGAIDANGYTKIYINRIAYYGHRLIFLYHHGYWPLQIDHIDRNPSNNIIDNLRESNQSQNMANVPEIKGGTSQFKGISWSKRSKKWKATIKENGINRHLGYFINEKKAAKSYNEAASRIYGEFAYLNGGI